MIEEPAPSVLRIMQANKEAMEHTGNTGHPAGGREIAGYRVDDLLVDLARQRVARGADEIKVPGLSFDLLVSLARRSPEFVSIATLMDEVWSGTVVSPETVSQRVKLLRGALGDDANQARYIAGLRGRGYRLVAGVTPLSSEDMGDASEAPHRQAAPETPASSVASRRVTVLALLVSLGLLVWVTWGRQAPREVQTPHTATIDAGHLPPGSVAVLPFGTLAADPALHDLGLVLAAAVHHRLAVQRELLVVARGSSFSIENPTDVRGVGRRLGARYLVQGTLQRAGDMLRVTVELVDVFTGMTVRELQFDRANNDVLGAPVEIAEGVAKALEITVNAIPADYSNYGVEAYLAYVRGNALLSTRKINDADAAAVDFARAIELAPRFASAYQALAMAKFQQVFLRNEYNPQTAKVLWPAFSALVSRALELDPDNGEAYFMRAKYKSSWLQDIAGADADYRRGMTLNPNYGSGLEDFANFLWTDAHATAESLAILERAGRVDPLSPRVPYLVGMIEWTDRGNLPEATAAFQRTLELSKEYYPAYLRLAQMAWNQGHLAEAIRLAEQGLNLEPGVVWGRMYLLYFYVDAGDLQAAREVLAGMSPHSLNAEALICTRAGNAAAADKLVNQAIRQGAFDGYWVTDAPTLDAAVARSLRDHRYDKAVRLIQPTIVDAERPEELLYDLDHVNGLVLRAVVEKEAGRRQAGREIVQKVLEILDRKSVAWYPGRADLVRAAALAAIDRSDDALASLEKAQSTAVRNAWWDTFGAHPAFASLRQLPRFQAVEIETRKWAERERLAIEAARVAHRIPLRRGSFVTPAGC